MERQKDGRSGSGKLRANKVITSPDGKRGSARAGVDDVLGTCEVATLLRSGASNPM